MSETPEQYFQHRGIREHGGLPNSFESIFKNWRGAQETDVILLADRNVAVFHEQTFGMTPEQAEALTLEDIQRMEIPADSPNVSGRSIPLFTEFIGLAADANTALRIDMHGSNQKKAVELARALIEQLARMEQAGGLRNNPTFLQRKIRFGSFSIPALRIIQQQAHNHKLPASTSLMWPSSETRAQAYPLFDQSVVQEVQNINDEEWNTRGIIIAAHNKFQEIALFPDVISRGLISLAHSKGLEVAASARDETEAQRLVELGVDRILVES